MICPSDKTKLEKAVFCNVEVDYCPACLGMWLEEEELRWAKDARDRNLNWLDFDLWEKEKDFKIEYDKNLCPDCRLPLYHLKYGDSNIEVDVCNVCKGIWLDRGEFKKIIDYLKEKAGYEILNHSAKNLFQEALEIFSGPETFKEEVLDFLTIFKLFIYKFWSKHSLISQIIANSPK